MVYKITEEQGKDLKDFYEETIKELGDFFGINWVRNKPKVFLVPDRKTINSLRGGETPNWVVGWGGAKTGVYILDSKNFLKESENSYTLEKWQALVKHELAHCFFDVATGGYRKPVWLSEGLSIHLSGQNQWKKPIKEFENVLEFYEKHGKEVYYESGFLVQLLVEKYGKEKLLELLGKIKEEKPDEKHFSKLFEETYGFELSYANLNEKLK